MIGSIMGDRTTETKLEVEKECLKGNKKCSDSLDLDSAVNSIEDGVAAATHLIKEKLSLNTSSQPNGIDHESKEIEYVSYRSELQMPDIMRLIQRDLSEPYSIYTYRYFIHNWPKLCFLVSDRLYFLSF